MLGLDKKENKKADEGKSEEMWAKLEKDFTVKNMPAFSRFSGTSYEGETVRPRKPADQQSARETGAVIVAGGVIVVLGIFYAGYIFLIKPSLKQPSPQVQVKEQTVKEPVVKEEEEVLVPETPKTEDLATSTTEEVVEPVQELKLPVRADADGDGLSDQAELLLGTDPQLADSDGDSYADSAELRSGYDPMGAGKFSDNRNLALYAPLESEFALVYPSGWEVNAANAGSVLFSAPDESFIQVSFEDLEQAQPDVLAWYRSQFTDSDDLDASRMIDSSFGPGIVSADGSIVYYMGNSGQRVYVLSYIRSGEAAPYQEIFRLMAVTMMPR